MAFPIAVLRPLPRPKKEPRPRRVLLISLCAFLDSVAAIPLLRNDSSPAAIASAAALHVAASLLLAILPDPQPSRRWMSVAALLLIPGAGAFVVATLFLTRPRGLAEIQSRPKTPKRRAGALAAARELWRELTPCDALHGADEEQRLSALSALARRDDSEALLLLRRFTAAGDPELAMQAALALDQIYERAERRRGRPAAAAETLLARG
jgi:hypothetical protein